MSVLNNAKYIPSYGTLGRALIKMEELLDSGLSHSALRKHILCDYLAKGNSMLISGEQIANYIKFASGDKSPVTTDDISKVLLQMQANYDKFGLNSENNTPKTDNGIDDDLKEKNMHKDKYNEGFTIAKFNAQKEGRPRPTYKELVTVFMDLEDLSTKQHSSDSGGYPDGR